ncbi:MAG: hypothetical protein IJA97_05255 [Clostridia bacterium]|nr:hypothetical protein [Clostridia bacterium]
MSSNLKTMKLTAILSGCLLIATFAICLNKSYGWFNIKWLSNDFLLTIFGGLFASTLVVLICEWQKYFFNKRGVEDFLWNNTINLYAKVLIMKNSVDKELVAPERRINLSMLDECSNIAKHILSSGYYVDYSTICKKQSLSVALKEFYLKKPLLERIVGDCDCLKIAGINDEINGLTKNPLQNYKVTNKDPETFKALTILSNNFIKAIGIIEWLLAKIDYSGRYNWQDSNKSIKENYNQIFKDFSYEDFLKQYKK